MMIIFSTVQVPMVPIDEVPNAFRGQSYKQFTLVIYESTVVI